MWRGFPSVVAWFPDHATLPTEASQCDLFVNPRKNIILTQKTQPKTVIPAKAGIQYCQWFTTTHHRWTPAFAGVTLQRVAWRIALVQALAGKWLPIPVSPESGKKQKEYDTLDHHPDRSVAFRHHAGRRWRPSNGRLRKKYHEGPCGGRTFRVRAHALPGNRQACLMRGP